MNWFSYYSRNWISQLDIVGSHTDLPKSESHSVIYSFSFWWIWHFRLVARLTGNSFFFSKSGITPFSSPVQHIFGFTVKIQFKFKWKWNTKWIHTRTNPIWIHLSHILYTYKPSHRDIKTCQSSNTCKPYLIPLVRIRCICYVFDKKKAHIHAHVNGLSYINTSRYDPWDLTVPRVIQNWMFFSSSFILLEFCIHDFQLNIIFIIFIIHRSQFVASYVWERIEWCVSPFVFTQFS